MRTALSKIEFRSGEGRGCNLSGSGRYPGNEAVSVFYSELRWHHASSDKYELSSLLEDGSFSLLSLRSLGNAGKMNRVSLQAAPHGKILIIRN